MQLSVFDSREKLDDVSVHDVAERAFETSEPDVKTASSAESML